jgi:hypothetical protein
MVGTPRDWIERATAQPVAYVYAGDPADVNVVWQQRFWNPRIAEVVSVAPSAVPGPIRTKKIVPAADGRLPITERLAVANNLTTFVGTPVANQDRGLDYPPLTLWRLDGAPRLNSVENGVKPNGDIIGSAGVTAYGCRGGTLQLTLLPKATDALVVALDGRVALRARIGGRDYWNGSVSVPAAHTSDVCHFTIRGGLLLGSTRIVFAGRRR